MCDYEWLSELIKGKRIRVFPVSSCNSW